MEIIPISRIFCEDDSRNKNQETDYEMESNYRLPRW